MAEFKIGDTVRNINTNQKGKIDVVLPARRGLQLYSVFYSIDCVKDENENDLELDIEVRDLFDRFLHGTFRGYNDFQVYNTTFKIENSSNNMLSSIKASKTLFKTYQYIPLMRFLNSDLRRLLIADEVGLGKTIESGHIMLEMKARGELKNVLIVCPSSLASKWQDEMMERFGLSFEIYDNKKMMREDLRGHSGGARGIITYESLADRKENKEDANKSALRFLEENNLRYSLVICDEAHRVRNFSTNRRDAVDRLLKQTDAVLFLTATPIMLGRKNLFGLLNLLNKQRFTWEDVFEEQVKHVEPFVWAINELNMNASFDDIRKGLDERIPEDDYIRELSRFTLLYKRLGEEDTIRQRALIQSDLYDINPLSSIMTRTRKVDVTTDLSQPTRETESVKVFLYPEEQNLFNKYMEEFSVLDSYTRTTRERQIASSVYGFNYIEGNGSEKNKDAKFDKLMEILKICREKGSGKMIVFVSFKNTLKYLAKKMALEGISIRYISGDDKSREERINAIEDFRTKNEIEVLLSTEVGGEGLDLQFCDTLVNYDLPWNPMVVEQRIGRIDRIGQNSKVIHIFTLIVKGSIQETINDRLLSRIEVFRTTIGDLEPILSANYDKDSTIEDAIKDLYQTELSPEQLEAKLSRIERAIERNMEDSKRLEKELQDSFTSDAYLRDHLNTILRKEAYVTEKELENYVRCLFRKSLPTCTISPLNKGLATISIPKSSPKALINFMMRYTTLAGEQGEVVSQFINNKLRDRDNITVTFSQEIAENNRNVTFLNIYHPLVLAAKEQFHHNSANDINVFRFNLQSNQLKISDKNIVTSGYYALAIYTISTEFNRYENKRVVQESFVTVYNIEKNDVEENQDVVDSFYRAIQTSGEYWDSSDTFTIEKDLLADMRVCMNEQVRKYCIAHENEVKMNQNDDVAQQRQGQNFRFHYLIEQQKLYIQETEDKISECNLKIMDGEGNEICVWDLDKAKDKMRTYKKAKEDFERVLPAMKGRLKSTESELETKTHELDSIPNPIVSSQLTMLNLIHVK